MSHTQRVKAPAQAFYPVQGPSFISEESPQLISV